MKNYENMNSTIDKFYELFYKDNDKIQKIYDLDIGMK